MYAFNRRPQAAGAALLTTVLITAGDSGAMLPERPKSV
jgi:hypothetical protein